jgi:hypothetical protein
MYRIRASQLLVTEIIDLWSEEAAQANPERRPNRAEAFEYALVPAWWRAEIGRSAGRLQLLRRLNSDYSKEILCRTLSGARTWAAGAVEDNRARRVEVIVPAADPARWTEEACRGAFEDLAILSPTPGTTSFRLPATSSAFAAILDVVRSVAVTREDFMAWANDYHCPFGPPEFWLPKNVRLKRPASGARSVHSDSQRVKRTPGPSPAVRNRVIRDMQAALKNGRITREALAAEKQEVLVRTYRCGRGTARQAREIVLASVAVLNTDK